MKQMRISTGKSRLPEPYPSTPYAELPITKLALNQLFHGLCPNTLMQQLLGRTSRLECFVHPCQELYPTEISAATPIKQHENGRKVICAVVL